MNILSGISEKNRTILDELNRARKGPFSVKEASGMLGISENEIRVRLAYFTRKGWLSRVKRGLYITIPLGTINPQEYKENPWIVADYVFAPCYIGGWSAAEHWELTDQIFNSIVVFTQRKFRNKNRNIKGTNYILNFFSTKNDRKTKSVWVENIKVQVSDPSQTIVDIIDNPSVGGGIRNIGDIVETYFESDYRNDTLIIDCIKARGNRTINKRLGYLIEALNIKAPELLMHCKKNISKGFSLLDPTNEAKGLFLSRWNLCVNAKIGR